MALFSVCCCSHGSNNNEITTVLEDLIDATVSMHRRLSKKMANLSEQLEELKAIQLETNEAIADEKAEVSAKLEALAAIIAALEARIIELGEVDPDIQEFIDAAKDNLEDVKAIVETPVAEEPEEPVEPTDETV